MIMGELKAVFVVHHTYLASEFVEFLNISMSHTRLKSILLLQSFFSCLYPHSYDPNNKNGAWKARSEGSQHRIIRNGQKIFPDSDPTDPEALIIGKAADKTPRTTRKCEKHF